MPTLALLKVPLLLCLAKYTYHGMTSPTLPPRPEEKKRVTAPDFLASMPVVHQFAVVIAKYIFCGLAATEALTLALHQLPSSLLSSRVLAALPPILQSTFAAGASLRLTPVSALGCVLGILGGLSRVWCYRTLGRFFTYEVAVRDGHKLVTSGPYAIVRHPSYTASYVLMVGIFMLLFSRGSLFVVSGLAQTKLGQAVAASLVSYMGWILWGMTYRTRTEDELLKKEFGAQWDEWAKRTPYRLLPFVY